MKAPKPPRCACRIWLPDFIGSRCAKCKVKVTRRARKGKGAKSPRPGAERGENRE